MENDLPGLRYEIKMEVSRDDYDRAQSWVRLSSAGFRLVYPTRWVNNLYFDTPGLDAYEDHLSGAAERRKLRFRWYGPDSWRAQGQLELKCKRGRVGWKRVQAIPAEIDFRAHTWAEFRQTLTGCALDPLLDELFGVSMPQAIIRYRRDYYVSADGLVRLTLDYDLRSYDQRFSARPNLVFAQPRTDRMVIEFKCAVADSRWLPDILAEFPIRVSRYSKYVAALDAMLER